MCLPVIAGIALAATAGAAVVNTIGAVKNAKSQKEQLAINAAANQRNSEIARVNAEEALDTANYNAGQLLKLTAVNATAKQAITDVNVGLAESISNFNLQVADSQGAMILARGDMQASYAEANAANAERNALLEEDNAQTSLEAGKKEEQTSRLNYARLKSTQRATLAANGMVLDEGSALRIQTDTDFFSDVDADMIHSNAVRAALGYRGRADNYNLEARMSRVEGSMARVNAQTEAFTVKAQAFGAKLSADRDILNMKLSTSFEILQAQSNAEINAANILSQGAQEARDYEMQAGGFEGAAKSALAARKGISPFMSGLGTALDGAASVAGKWYSYGKAA